jgi:diguanylate cyclase (GGDEF)-like protein
LWVCQAFVSNRAVPVSGEVFFLKSLKVLYIEDNPENALLIRRVLEAEGLEVVVAENGLAGVRLAASERPDLILMDMMMPGLDGREATTRLRAIEAMEKIPIVALTASVMKGDSERAIAAGCDGYLQKPIDVERFPHQIREFLYGKRETLSPGEELHYLREHNKRLAERLDQKIERLSDISEANRRLADISLTDELTGLPNRRYLNRRLREEWAMAKRFGQPLSCIMIDLDHFKSINDTFGHPAGDAVLQSLAKVMSDGKRDYDVVGRYGGEEFLFLLPQADEAGASAMAERLRVKVETRDLTSRLGQPIRLTISLGIAVSDSRGDFSEEEWVRRADEALYQAKSQGRNRAVLYRSRRDRD